MPSINIDKDTKRAVNTFISERVINYWNLLPTFCKVSSSIDSFKINLDRYKNSNYMSGKSGNFWEVSDLILQKIEGKGYLDCKFQHNSYLFDNPSIASRKGINISNICNN